MPITVNTTDTFEQWRLKTNDIGSAIETNVSSVYSTVYSALSANIAAVNSNIASNVSTINSSIASNVSTVNSSIASNATSVSSTINSSIASNVSTINSSIASNAAAKLSLTGGTMTGAITTPNGAIGINIGDDARLSDRNISNTAFLEGQQNSDRGYINFSSTSGNDLGSTNGGALAWRGATVLHASNYNSYAPTLTGTGASGTWGISISGTAATATSPAGGGSFITSTNIGSQSVNFATSATNATNATNATYASNPAAGGSFITTSNYRNASGYDYLTYASMPTYVWYFVRGDVSFSLNALPATGSWVTTNLSGIFSLRPNLDVGGGLEASGLVQYLLCLSNFTPATPSYAPAGYFVARKNNGVWIDDEIIGGYSYFTLNKGEWITQIAGYVVPVGDGGDGGGGGGVF